MPSGRRALLLLPVGRLSMGRSVVSVPLRRVGVDCLPERTAFRLLLGFVCLFAAGDGTQGLVHAKHKLSCTPSHRLFFRWKRDQSTQLGSSFTVPLAAPVDLDVSS